LIGYVLLEFGEFLDLLETQCNCCDKDIGPFIFGGDVSSIADIIDDPQEGGKGFGSDNG
jgi:hypothetical protein